MVSDIVNGNHGQCIFLWNFRQIEKIGGFIPEHPGVIYFVTINSATRKQNFQNCCVQTVMLVHVKYLILSLFIFCNKILVYSLAKLASLPWFLSMYCRRVWEIRVVEVRAFI